MTMVLVLIRIIPGHESIVYDELAKIPQIIEHYPLFNNKKYNIIIKIELKNNEDLEDIITNKIKCLQGVVNIKTLTGPIVMNTQEELNKAFAELNAGTFIKTAKSKK